MKRIPLKAGAAAADITPQKSMFLFGYPRVERYSEGVHDPLYASAIVLDNADTQIVFCAVDIIFVGKTLVSRVRKIVNQVTAIPEKNIMISASHTHSGPLTVNMISNKNDPVIPPVDNGYIDFLVQTLSSVIISAHGRKTDSELAITTASGEGVGGNRRSKNGVTDPEIPVIVVRRKTDRKISAVSTTYCMHPTVLHEDSRLYSADFPGYVREYILDRLGKDTVCLYQTGPAGNQSPRYFINGTTFDEARRLGYMLGERIVSSVSAVPEREFKTSLPLGAAVSSVKLPLRKFPLPEEADSQIKSIALRLERLKKKGVPYAEIRTAECDLFGAEEVSTLSRMSLTGELNEIVQAVLPAEIQVFRIDNSYFVNIPGEYFVEYSLAIKAKSPHKTFVVSLSNGELQGYIVTRESYAEGGYEASNGLFPPEAGDIIVEKTIQLIKRISASKAG